MTIFPSLNKIVKKPSSAIPIILCNNNNSNNYTNNNNNNSNYDAYNKYQYN